MTVSISERICAFFTLWALYFAYLIILFLIATLVLVPLLIIFRTGTLSFIASAAHLFKWLKAIAITSFICAIVMSIYCEFRKDDYE
jgi:hypothetical protein